MRREKEIPAYLKLLNLLSAIRELPPYEELSADEEVLLNDLVVRWHSRRKVSVSELMQDTKHVSSSTMYRRVIALREKGFVDLPADLLDRRCKYVEPTESARNYIRKLDACIEKLSNIR